MNTPDAPLPTPPSFPPEARAFDAEAFAHARAHWEGSFALAHLPRLAAACVGLAGDAPLHWQADGETRAAGDGVPRPALRLQLACRLPLECQRCLQPLEEAVDVDRHFIFAPDEDTAAQLDEECDDDVLAPLHDTDLLTLIEDELLLALPPVPRHADCRTPVDAAGEPPPHPFAALAALKGNTNNATD